MVGVPLEILFVGQRGGELTGGIAEEEIAADVAALPVDFLVNAGFEGWFAAGIVGSDEALDFTMGFFWESIGCHF